MKLGIVVPCYNEEAVLHETANRLLALLDRLVDAEKIAPDSKIYFIDDGSKDRTWSIIDALAQKQPRIAGIKLSRNRGHQNALVAGLLTVDGDAVVSIDADLQDDISVIEEMISEYNDGVDVVYGVRKKRETDTAFKRITAELFYKLINMLGAESILNHADYRLMSRRALEALQQFKEVNLFLRGIVPLIGFRSSIVYYDRGERLAGESKYPLKRMIALALDAVTSFSIVPLRIITFIGFSVFLLTILLTIWVLYIRFFTARAIPGWASTVLPIYFISGIQILCLGVIGEYVGKAYSEIKARPRFVIEKIVNP